jgi:hypothetical protein
LKDLDLISKYISKSSYNMVLNPILETIKEETYNEVGKNNNIIYEIDLVISDNSYDIETSQNNNTKDSVHTVKIYCTVFVSFGVILTGCIYVMSILKQN